MGDRLQRNPGELPVVPVVRCPACGNAIGREVHADGCRLVGVDLTDPMVLEREQRRAKREAAAATAAVFHRAGREHDRSVCPICTAD